MPSVSMDPLTGDPRSVFNQQISHIAHAHRQALKLMFEGQQPYPLTVRGCTAYYNTAKEKLSETEFQKFIALIDSCTEPDFDVLSTLVEICEVLHRYPDLIQGFGMFLPPDLNLQVQSGDYFPFTRVKEEIDSCSEMSEAEELDEGSSQKETEMETAMDVEVGDAEVEKASTSSAQKNPDLLQKPDKGFALSFLSKVKERFGSDLEVFGRFLELLNSVKQSSPKSQDNIETEVFFEVCELFCGHNDLIDEFKVFVPHATYGPTEQDSNDVPDHPEESATSDNVPSSPETSGVSKFSFVNDPSIATVYKYGSFEEHGFFDEVRSAVGHKEVYDNFLRCLMLFNEDVITRSELIKIATSFLGKFPDLLRQFKDKLGYNESGNNVERIPMKIIKLENQRECPEVGMDIDYRSGGRNGANYRALPASFFQPRCTGRTSLCTEVLNDTWVSFPSWSEDSTFVTSCKTQYEEIIYRCEDERFELDMAITANSGTMAVLTDIQKKMNKMGFEERQMLHLDDSLGTGGSTVIHQRALHRLYGDKTGELVEGLKRNPWVAVPIILKRLKAKDEEWKERQKRYNDIWRTQIDQYYLKSLDHQGINFKQNDSKSFRPKSLLNEMEMVYAEKKESQGFNSAHFVLEFKEMEVFQDAIDLMLQYLKKLPGVYREDRRKIELVIRSLIPDFFGTPRCTLKEEDLEVEDESGDPEEPMDIKQDEEERSGQTTPTGSNRDECSSDLDESNSNETDNSDEADKSFVEEIDVFDRVDPLPVTNLPYTLFFANKPWYIFFRQFHILCERLSRLLLESSKQGEVLKTEPHSLNAQILGRTKPTYRELIDKLSLLLSGTIDYSQFEEESRNLFGIHAFVSFTMDKLVLSIVRQLQQIVTDDISKHCTFLFIQGVKVVAAAEITSPMEASQMEHNYLKKVEKVMEEERCFKAVWHKKEDTLTIELIEHESEEDVSNPIETEKWSNYLDDFLNDELDSEDILTECEQLPVILPRNLRKMKAHWKRKVAEIEKSWELRQSAKFSKKNIMTNKKRKAIALLSQSLTKMARRSSNLDGSVHSSSSRAPSADGYHHPEASNVLEELNFSEDPIPESMDDKVDMEQHNPEVRVIITTEEDSEKSELVLVELSGDEMGVQEESVEDTDLEVEVKFENLNPESLSEGQEINIQYAISESESDEVLETIPEEEPEEAMAVEEAVEVVKESSQEGVVVEESSQEEVVVEESSQEEVVVEEASQEEVVVEESSQEEVVVEESSRGEAVFEESSQEEEEVVEEMKENAKVVPEEKNEECQLSLEEAVREVGTELNLLKMDTTVVTSIDAVPEEEFKEDEIQVEDLEKPEDMAETAEEDSPKRESGPLKRRIVSKPYDYSIRTRKNRTNQTYVKRRMKRGIVRSLQSTKGKRKRSSGKAKSGILDDPTFDYNCFSELSLEDKVHRLVFMYLTVKDDVEVSFKPGSYKINFVQDCNLYLYRGKSLIKAKEVHQSISEIKSSNFNSWHRVWLDRYVTPSMLKFCNDWLLKSDAEKYKLVCMNVSDCKKPPYIPYYKYKLRYYKIEAQ